MSTNRNQYNRSHHYRAGDNRKFYPNRDQRQDRQTERGWPDRRFDRDSRSVGRPEAYKQTNPTSQLPGIPVSKNQLTKPFEANKDGSGDKTEVEAMNDKMANLELKAKDITSETEKTTDLSSNATDSKMNGGQPEVKDEPKSVTTTDSSNPLPTTTSGPSIQRRYTVGSDTQYWKTFRNRNEFSGQKSYQTYSYHNGNRYQNDPNRKFNKFKGKSFVTGGQTDFGQHLSPYGYNFQDQCTSLPHYYIPNPIYPNIGYPPLPPITNGSQDLVTDSGLNQKGVDAEQKSKALDQINPTPLTPYFVPFVPTPALPEPPPYYGHIVTYTSDTGLIPFFICDIPNYIAPLQLEVHTNGFPILPRNCHLINLQFQA